MDVNCPLTTYDGADPVGFAATCPSLDIDSRRPGMENSTTYFSEEGATSSCSGRPAFGRGWPVSLCVDFYRSGRTFSADFQLQRWVNSPFTLLKAGQLLPCGWPVSLATAEMTP